MCGQGVNSGPPLSAVMPLRQSKARRPQLKRNDGRISSVEFAVERPAVFAAALLGIDTDSVFDE